MFTILGCVDNSSFYLDRNKLLLKDQTLQEKRVFVVVMLLIIPWELWAWVFNNPYPQAQASQRVYYTSFTQPPKTLDPARAYASTEYQFLAQIYEPLFEYDYFDRPYHLIPLSAASMPEVRYLDAHHQSIAVTDEASMNIAYTVYTLHLKHGMYYQPHPALAQDERGQYRYHRLLPDYLDAADVNFLTNFPETGSREVIADDYIYEIKRLANPANNSPIYGLMAQYIEGFANFAKQLPVATLDSETFIDLRAFPMRGLRKIDDYTFEITVYGQYPQFVFWLAMPFFSPIPWEAEAFYAQKNMKQNNFSLSWYPIGSGPFMLVENNPNQRMVLRKNPQYYEDFFPSNGSEADRQAGYMQHAGERIPLLDEVIFTLEKESTPRWNKFLQGYYDLSVVSLDSFDQAIQLNPDGKPMLTPAMKAKQISLSQANEANVFYIGFNMLDPVVGGRSERARKLRLAISLAVNFEEYIAIFYNGRGVVVQGPIPPGIMDENAGPSSINPYLYQWHDGKARRLPLDKARRLMAQAGYPHGIDPKTGHSLILNYDISMSGSPDEKAQLDWIRKQFAKIGIDLNIRATQFNRFQEKMRQGNAQIFYWGWSADYPDPESFLFLLYGPSGKAKYGGENAANYHNARYDQLFDQMKNRPNDAKRRELIDQMVALVRHDAPWVWGINTETLMLAQRWMSPVKPHAFTYNTLKFMSVDLPLRAQLRAAWNQAILWPLAFIVIFFLITLIPFFWAYWRRERSPARRVGLRRTSCATPMSRGLSAGSNDAHEFPDLADKPRDIGVVNRGEPLRLRNHDHD